MTPLLKLNGWIASLLLTGFLLPAYGQVNPPVNMISLPHYVVIGPYDQVSNMPCPVGYNLLVAGGILTERLRVANQGSTNWADYVFAPTYHLAPLPTVKAYIARHGHLPGIPSAADVERDGVDVGQTQALLLAKIEELTLHLIRQQEQINRLSRQAHSRRRSHKVGRL